MLSKDSFVFIEYNGVPYPEGYYAEIREVAGHLDKNAIEDVEKYSLHTEYSYGKRKFDTPRLSAFPVLREANKDGVPQLWKSDEWAEEFADFIIGLTQDHNSPEIIEIHPPFNDYCSLEEFAERYLVFEHRIHAAYPDNTIVIENRSGAVYRGGKFLVGKAKEIAALCEIIRQRSLKLGVVLDFPQLLTAEGIDTLKFKTEKYQAAIDTIIPYRDLIRGVHIWGKKKSATGRWVAHAGNLDTYFGDNQEAKALFISGIEQICNDGVKRFLVPEVNSGSTDLDAIVRDIFTN
jgi:hypothetical protein